MVIFSMQKNLLIALIVSLLAGSPAPASDELPSGREIRIVTWNIEWYPGKRRFARGAEMAAHAGVVKQELRQIDPDILLAQEIRDWQSFADLVEEVPGLQPVTVSAFVQEDSGEYWNQQIAIASKLPVMAAWSESWQEGAIHPRRGFAAAAIRPGPGLELLLVYSLHLKSNRSENEEEAELNFRTREESIRQLLKHVQKMEEEVFPGRIAGVVVGGDFNTNHDGQFGDRVVDMMKEAGFHHAWSQTPKSQRLTWRGSDRFDPTTFDHFFLKGLDAPESVMLEVSDEASDHWPVEIRIFFPFQNK